MENLAFTNLIFCALFLSQAALISFYYSRRIITRMERVLEDYPPSEYPKLYPRPVEHYKRNHRNFRLLNNAIFGIGLIMTVVFLLVPRSGEWNHAYATWYFLFQISPVLLLDIRALKESRLMREANHNRKRKAELRPRSLFDFITPLALGISIATYLGFVGLIIYIRQFDFPWFGGYLNIVGVTGLNLFLAAFAYRRIYGKKFDPYQAHEDRMAQTTALVNSLLSVSVAATLFIAMDIILAAIEMRHLKPITQCIYFLIIATLSLQVYLKNKVDFEVYRRDLATN